MSDFEISKDIRIKMSDIDDQLIKLYEAAVAEERNRVLNLIRELIQEKDMRCDYIAVDILEWMIGRILGGK